MAFLADKPQYRSRKLLEALRVIQPGEPDLRCIGP